MAIMREGMGAHAGPSLNDYVARMLNRALTQIGSDFTVVKQPKSSEEE